MKQRGSTLRASAAHVTRVACTPCSLSLVRTVRVSFVDPPWEGAGLGLGPRPRGSALARLVTLPMAFSARRAPPSPVSLLLVVVGVQLRCCARAAPTRAHGGALAWREELLLGPAEGGRVRARWHFQADGEADALAQLLRESEGVAAYAARLSAGRSVSLGRARGAELAAYGEEAVDERTWTALAAALGGLLSADFRTAAADTLADTPTMLTAPATFNSTAENGSRTWRYGASPAEFACTENVVRALRLLPGGATAAGLRTLIKPATFAASDAFSVGVTAAREKGVVVDFEVVLRAPSPTNADTTNVTDLLRTLFGVTPEPTPAAELSLVWLNGVAHNLNANLAPANQWQAPPPSPTPRIVAHRAFVPRPRAQRWGCRTAQTCCVFGSAASTTRATCSSARMC